MQEVQKASERWASCSSCSSCTCDWTAVQERKWLRSLMQSFAQRVGPPATLPRPKSTRPRGQAIFVINPMKNSATVPRDHKQPAVCGARTRAGTPCQRHVIRGRNRCRLHGGLSPGAPRGPKNGNYKNGDWTAEAIEERKWLRLLVKSFAKSKDIR